MTRGINKRTSIEIRNISLFDFEGLQNYKKQSYNYGEQQIKPFFNAQAP